MVHDGPCYVPRVVILEGFDVAPREKIGDTERMGQRNPINHQFGMVETLDIMGCLPPFSTGAGFRNHPQYAVHEYSLYMQCTHAVHDFGRF